MTFKVDLDVSDFKRELEKLIEKAIRMNDSEQIEAWEEFITKFRVTKVEGIGKYKFTNR